MSCQSGGGGRNDDISLTNGGTPLREINNMDGAERPDVNTLFSFCLYNDDAQ